MIEPLLFVLVLLAVAAVVLLLVLLKRSGQETSVVQLARLDTLDRSLERNERLLREELAQHSRDSREEQRNSLRAFGESLLRRSTEIAGFQKSQLDTFAEQLKTLTQLNEQKFNTLRETVEGQLKSLQEDNNKKLEQMRATVDEKLHATLEKRLGESFKLVSERLEQVHKGLGEMQSLAAGVGDLKKVLTNVKTRGNFGEIQLGSLLEQLLTPEQYEANVATQPGSSQRVEFAIRLPGRDGNRESQVWLPIDAKFPQEDYLRLVEAQEQGNPQLVEESSRQLEKTVREMARNIRDKYLAPPHTTDFGIMFLPTEGLYAEVLRRTGLCESLQRECKVILTGPTTLAALLNSLQLEQRSSEVWALLGAVKTEFATFGDILDKTRKKLQEAGNTIEAAAVRSRAIEKRLRTVQELPADAAKAVLAEAGLPGEDQEA
jgi:DNA recombination protein RmuC